MSASGALVLIGEQPQRQRRPPSAPRAATRQSPAHRSAPPRPEEIAGDAADTGTNTSMTMANTTASALRAPHRAPRRTRTARIARRAAEPQPPADVFDIDDRVIDNFAERDDQSAMTMVLIVALPQQHQPGAVTAGSRSAKSAPGGTIARECKRARTATSTQPMASARDCRSTLS